MRYLIFLLLVFLAAPADRAHGQSADRVALITDVSGTVEVASSGETAFSSVSWGQPLFDGDRIRTTDGGSASLLFSNNSVLKLGPNSSLTITPDAVQSESMSGPVRELDGELIAAADLTLHRAGEGEIAALGGLRSGSAESSIRPLSPVNTRILGERPVFKWNADESFESFRVVVRSGEGEIWSLVTESTEVEYPADAPALVPGATYYWHVEAETMLDSVQGPITTFTPVDSSTRDEVVSGRNRIDTAFESALETSEYHYVLGSYLASRGLLGEAITAFKWIAERHPDSPAVHRILGTLYSDVGMKDDAIRSLQKAVQLSDMK